MDGCSWMGSDDDFSIRQELPIGLPWGQFCSWARCGWFFTVKICIIVDMVYLHVF
jgi:hypothetical protein